MYNTAGTVEETIQWCSAFSPSHMNFRLRETAWKNGARNTKNYIQLQVTVKEFVVLGVQRSCSLHFFLTRKQSEWPVRSIYTPHPFHVHQQVCQSFATGQMFDKPEFVTWKGERFTESGSLEQLVLILLVVVTNRMHSVRFRSSWR
jgi:hypothetical protein